MVLSSNWFLLRAGAGNFNRGEVLPASNEIEIVARVSLSSVENATKNGEARSS
jgi:hypothetical protein